MQQIPAEKCLSRHLAAGMRHDKWMHGIRLPGGGRAMHRVVWIESATRGVLVVNGCFCGPVDAQGQAFPASENAEIYMQLFPLAPGAQPVTVELVLEKGGIAKLSPQDSAYALIWPDGIIQLELRAQGQ